MFVLALLVAAARAEAPDLPGIAAADGFPAAHEALTALLEANPKAKKRERALAAARLGEVRMPVDPIAGADLALGTVSPATGCRWDDGLVCAIRAEAKGEVRAEEFRAVCRTRFGGALPVELVPAGPGPTWEAKGLESCWEGGGVALKLLPMAHDDLEGVGEGTDFIPPELVQLSWQEVERILLENVKSFQLCTRRDGEAGTRSGKLVVAFRIAEDGTIADARIDSGTVPDEELQACILDRFRRVRFPPPMGGYEEGTFPFTVLY